MAGFRPGQRQRGATLTLIAFVSGMMLLAMGTLYLTGAEQAYRLALLREREARVWAAVDAGLAEALTRFRGNPAVSSERQSFALERDGAKVDVSTAPGAGVEITVKAASGTGDLVLERRLIATVDFSGASPRVVEVSRDAPAF